MLIYEILHKIKFLRYKIDKMFNCIKSIYIVNSSLGNVEVLDDSESLSEDGVFSVVFSLNGFMSSGSGVPSFIFLNEVSFSLSKSFFVQSNVSFEVSNIFRS